MCQRCAATRCAVFRPARPWEQMHLQFKQCGTGSENDNCIGLKLVKNTCVALRRVYDRALKVILVAHLVEPFTHIPNLYTKSAKLQEHYLL